MVTVLRINQMASWKQTHTKNGGGGKGSSCRTLINSQVKSQLIYYKRREPQLGLQHCLQGRHLSFCHEVLVGTLESVENQNHHVGYAKQRFHS